MTDRQRWDYCDVRPDATITYYGAIGLQPSPDQHGEAFGVEEAVAWLGARGWELVTVVLDSDGRTFYLKRPSTEPAIENGHAVVAEAEPTAEEIEEMPVIAVADPARPVPDPTHP